MSVFSAQSDGNGELIFEWPEQLAVWLRRTFPTPSALEVEIREQRTKRSLRQNAAFHALLSWWARDEGHNIDDLKRDVLREVFGMHERTNPITGEVTESLNEPHSSKLSVAKFCELIERTLEIAAGCGVVLQAPDEYRKAKEQAAKKGRHECSVSGLSQMSGANR